VLGLLLLAFWRDVNSRRHLFTDY